MGFLQKWSWDCGLKDLDRGRGRSPRRPIGAGVLVGSLTCLFLGIGVGAGSGKYFQRLPTSFFGVLPVVW